MPLGNSGPFVHKVEFSFETVCNLVQTKYNFNQVQEYFLTHAIPMPSPNSVPAQDPASVYRQQQAAPVGPLGEETNINAVTV